MNVELIDQLDLDVSDLSGDQAIIWMEFTTKQIRKNRLGVSDDAKGRLQDFLTQSDLTDMLQRTLFQTDNDKLLMLNEKDLQWCRRAI